nr:unnamed protein product [Digitaria exilis]
MASINLSLAATILLSGLVIMAAMGPGEATCTLSCAYGAYITCTNSPGKNFTGCACQYCAPPGCTGCVVRYDNSSSTLQA